MEVTFLQGKNAVCVPTGGEYEVEMPRCYEFAEKALTYSTTKEEVLKIQPVRFGVEGKI